MGRYTRRPSGLLVPPEPRVHRPPLCDLVGFDDMTMAVSEETDPFFPLVRGLVQPRSTDKTIKDYSSHKHTLTTSGASVVGTDPTYPSPWQAQGYGTVKLDVFSGFPGIRFPTGAFLCQNTEDYVLETVWHYMGVASGVPLDVRDGGGPYVNFTTTGSVAGTGRLGRYDGASRVGTVDFPLNAYVYNVYLRSGGVYRWYSNRIFDVSYAIADYITEGVAPYLLSSVGGPSDYFQGRMAAWRFTVGTDRGWGGLTTIPPLLGPFATS